MSEITLKAIEQLLDLKLEPINTKLSAIEEIVSEHTEILTRHSVILAGHTNTLDHIAKDVKILLDEKTV